MLLPNWKVSKVARMLNMLLTDQHFSENFRKSMRREFSFRIALG